jgi:hypothetical protein
MGRVSHKYAAQQGKSAAVSAQAVLRFMVHDGAVTAMVFIELCKTAVSG